MDNNRYSVQDALAVIHVDDSEGCESSSDEDLEDPDYTPKDMENDESSESSDSDCSESGDLDEVPQTKINPGQQNTTTQDNHKSPPPPPKRVCVGVPGDVHVDQVAHWPVKCNKHGH